MPAVDILSPEFERAVAVAGLRARTLALNSGHPVVFLDPAGRYVEEFPDGRRLEVRFQAGVSRDQHLCVVGDLEPHPG